jgi:hypothetical protein
MFTSNLNQTRNEEMTQWTWTQYWADDIKASSFTWWLVNQLINEFFSFYGTGNSIAVFTQRPQFVPILSWMNPIDITSSSKIRVNWLISYIRSIVPRYLFPSCLLTTIFFQFRLGNQPKIYNSQIAQSSIGPIPVTSIIYLCPDELGYRKV